LKILMVIPTFKPVVGGAERQLEGIAPLLTKLGCTVEVVTRRLSGAPAVDDSAGYRVRRLSTLGLRFGFHLSLIAFLLFRGHRHQVIHCHTLSGPAAICAFIGTLLRRPVLLKVTRSGPGSQIRGWQETRLRRLIFRLIQRSGARFVSISSDTLAELKQQGVPDRQLDYIPNGVTVPEFTRRQAAGPVTIVYTGRLIPRKRVDLLLRAFAATLAASSDKATLTIAGAGPEFGQLQGWACDQGIQDTVRFAGELDHQAVLSQLVVSDIFVLPSESEGMSNSLLEAMASGAVIVCSDIPANRELIEPGVSGLLFRDVNELSDHLGRLIADSGLRHQLARNAHQRVRDGYSFEAIAARYRDLYTSAARLSEK
jgi:glycosyltransferase involved in cell wall biosynthesis